MDCAVKAYEGQESFIFVSYAHDDAHLVYPIIERMVMDGFRVWYDDGIHAGEDWTDKVASRLDDSSIVVAMLSENSVASINCRNEIAYSLSARKNLIGIKLTEFDMPGGLRLQLGNTMYLERTRYGETEFYERLSLSHGMGSCRDEDRRISDEELIRWRDKWSNATPIRRARRENEKVVLHGPPPTSVSTSATSPSVTPVKKKSRVGLIVAAVAGVALLAVLLIVFLKPRGQTSVGDSAGVISEPSASEAAALPQPSEETPEALVTEPAESESAEDPLPVNLEQTAEETEVVVGEADWVTLDTTGKEGELAVLSYYVSNGTRITNADAFVFHDQMWFSFDWVGNTTTYQSLICSWDKSPFSEEYVMDQKDLYLNLWKKDVVIPSSPENTVTTAIPDTSDSTVYVLLLGIGKDFDLDCYIILELGIPQQTVILDESWPTGSIRISIIDSLSMQVELTDNRIPDGFPHSETPGNTVESWGLVLNFGRAGIGFVNINLNSDAKSLADVSLSQLYETSSGSFSPKSSSCSLNGNTFSFTINIPESMGITVADISEINVNLGTEVENFVDNHSFPIW